MRHRVVQIEKERASVGALNEIERLASEKIVRVVAVDVGFDPLRVSIQMVGELTMRVAVVQESECVLEPLLVRLAWASNHAESPFSDDRGPISTVAQRHGR